MKNLVEEKKKIANEWFKSLQDKIITHFQLFENEASKKKVKKQKNLLKESGKKIIKMKVVEFLIF